MTANGWIQILLFAAIVFAVTKPLGSYMFRVFEGDRQPLPRLFGPIERLLYRLCGVDPQQQQDWTQYTVAMLVFSAITLLVTYAIERLQHILPLNPQQFGPVPADLAFNTAASFTTNTNWQSYSGESTMSYLTQMAGLAWHNFMSAAVGIGIALALARGITYRLQAGAAKTLGNFWVDLIRATVYVLIPISIPIALLLVSQGVIQNFSSYVELTTLEGVKQTLAMGPVASQEVIKELGTNGGGFFNANSAHPFESPTPLTNFIEMVLIFAIPGGAHLYLRPHGAGPEARMGDLRRHGGACSSSASRRRIISKRRQPDYARHGGGSDGGEHGRERRSVSVWPTRRFSRRSPPPHRAARSIRCTIALPPLGGLVPLVNIQLGEVIFGGVGAGLYGMLIYRPVIGLHRRPDGRAHA